MNYSFRCKCDQCPPDQQCCGEFDGISNCLTPVENRLFSDIILTNADVEKMKNAGLDDIFENRNGLYFLKMNPNGSCPHFSNDRKCLIYENRPSLCKAYPLYLDMFGGLCYINSCPGTSNQKESDSNYSDQVNALLDVYQQLIDYYRTQFAKG